MVSANRVDGNLWVRQFHPAPTAATKLVCLPHAGGSASYFLPVSKALAPGVDVLAIQYPGRQDRRHEKCIDNIAELADAVTAVLEPLADRPLVLFGHSMGATLAFEVALRLERKGIVPLALFASGRRAPSRHRDESVHLRGDDEIIAELKTLSGTRSEVLGDEEILRMVLPAIRSDYKAAETYRYAGGARLTAPIHAHFGVEDPRVSLDEAQAWADHTTGHFELRSHPGGHFYLNDQAPRVIEEIARVSSSVAS
ncbi:oleoyl-ACP hydrolase [Streptomyces avermitilis]|uniref:Oleoyl-ACP hydrolase n=1 Tax=Streptomyces avermitilis TaxID=33903 RepID=A0A4D4LTJ0_STRAX|nr:MULTISPECIES: alpha/beta fold hydrolase [Streptomyces]KUN56138.1 oleoyl-ACP hydrolase [Streptomyces avermitilis]MYS98500.1 alpha/beta fold hydrolase [Streptomyces sp. SID5469]OOV33110.1 thioesterase [Streptomyces avermitilis]BBJ50738.1 oleoyl-ACP hydrolase [Streptomyces avermitilis]GDY62760.1 oleoyl-ACP hydrolase [Streptomyces avermitilis]